MVRKLLEQEPIEAIFSCLEVDNINPKTELVYKSTFELLIAVILSAQATDISVNKVTRSLFQEASTPKEMHQLGVEGIKKFIKTIGLFNSKAKNIYHCCKTLVETFDSKVPSTRKELESLAGVGVKTAGVVLNVAFKKPTIPVDTHVFRVSNRLGLVDTDTPNATEIELLKIVPEAAKLNAHHWLILHGRYICKARKPLCSQCKLMPYCNYFKNNKDL